MNLAIFSCLSRTAALAALITALGGPLASNGVAQRSTPAATEPPLIRVSYEGGYAADYVEAIRKAAGGINVFIAPEAVKVPMPPMELTNVTIPAALSLLHERLHVDATGQVIRLRFDDGQKFAENEQPIYSIVADIRGQSMPPGANRVWSVAHLLKHDMKGEDILTAIETSLSLFESNVAKVQLKFHEATGLLIARGSGEQMAAINEVIEGLSASVAARRPPQASPNDQQQEMTRNFLQQQIADRDRRIALLQDKIFQLEIELGKLRAGVKEKE